MTKSTIAAACLGLVTTFAAAQDDAPPLDQRIDSSKITESAPPPPPAVIAQPLPAIHRIATAAATVPVDEMRFNRAHAAIEHGLSFLRKNQARNGEWLADTEAQATDQHVFTPVSVAVTALAVRAFAQADAEGATMHRGVDALLEATGSQQRFALGEEGRLGTYVASSVASAFAAVNSTRTQDRLLEAVEFLKTAQWDDAEGLSPKADWYGGVGYGKKGRPDLSNTQMMLDALHDAGVSPEEPAVQRALLFVTRAQNLKSTNNTAWAQAGRNDGGFIYTPANGGESMASEYAGEGRYGELLEDSTARSLRSYGSMTYAGFKSLLYAGLTRDDPRVKAAWNWARRHWGFDENPGLGQQGRFYYLHAMSRALVAAQQAQITTPDGEVHDWREELIDTLTEDQRPDGAWVNSSPRWLESEAVLTTIYAILALEEALKPTILSD